MYSPPPTLACRILQSVWVSNLAMTKRCSHSHFLPRQPFLQDDARTGGLTGGTCSSDDKRAKMGMEKWGARTGHTSSFTCRVAETGKTIHFSALPFAMHPIILSGRWIACKHSGCITAMITAPHRPNSLTLSRFIVSPTP